MFHFKIFVRLAPNAFKFTRLDKQTQTISTETFRRNKFAVEFEKRAGKRSSDYSARFSVRKHVVERSCIFHLLPPTITYFHYHLSLNIFIQDFAW